MDEWSPIVINVTVIEAPAPVDTGLVRPDGTPIVRTPRPIGFPIIK